VRYRGEREAGLTAQENLVHLSTGAWTGDACPKYRARFAKNQTRANVCLSEHKSRRDTAATTVPIEPTKGGHLILVEYSRFTS
jgi:hypothetical protein